MLSICISINNVSLHHSSVILVSNRCISTG